MDAPASSKDDGQDPYKSPEATAEVEQFAPGGVQEVFTLAVPMAISTATYAVLQLTDRLFLAWYSAEGVAAALSGGVLVWVFMCLPFGVAGYVQAFIAQYLGAKREKEIGPILAQGVWVGLVCIPLFVCILPLAPLFFYGEQSELKDLEVSYFRISLLGAPAVVLAAAYGAFFNGRGKPKTEMTSSLIATAVNIVLDYMLIFGEWGAPEWGVAGAAWATILSQWLKVAILAYCVYTPQALRDYGVRFWSGLPNWRLLGRLLYFGVPAGMQYFVETGTFTLLVFFIRDEGNSELAATSLALSLNMFAFTPVFGMGMAVSALVGKYLGKDQPQYAARSTWTAMMLAIGFTFFCAVLYFSFPDLLFALHEGDQEGGSNAATVEMAKGLLRFAAIYCMLDAAQVIFVSALRGAGDTAFVFLVSTGIPLVTVVSARFLRQYADDWGISGLYWWWSVVTLWLLLLFLVFCARFLWGGWKSMRVIEPEVIV
jgi:MATE family multidrug resistance protein